MPGVRLSTLVRRLRRDAAPIGPGCADAELLARFTRHRDEAAFELLVWRHGAMVLSACRRVLRHAEDAEDAFQAAFLVLARKAGGVSRGAALPAWLHRVAVRISTRLARSRRVAAMLEVEPAARPAADHSDELGILDEEINRLSERLRLAVVLCYLEGLTAAEAGARLGCPTGTVESRLAAARKKLRDRLTARGVTLPAGVLALLAGHATLAPEAVARISRAALAFVRDGTKAASEIAGESPVRLAQGAMTMWHAKTWAALVVVAVAVAATAGIGWANRPEPPAPEPAATPAADAAGPAIPAKQPAAAANQRTSIRFTGPVGMKVTWQLPGGGFNDEASGLTAPTEHNFLQGQVYRLRLTQIPNFPGKTCYPTLEVSPATPKTTTFLAHASVPVTFNEEDFEQAVEGNLVVKVVYLPDPTFRDLSNVGGTEEIVSTRLEPGTDPVAEAQRRGTVLAIIRLGNIDLENKGTAPLPPNLERDGPAEPRVQKEYWGEPVAFGRLGKEWSYFLAISPDGKRMLVHHHQEMFCVDLASASLVWRVRVGGLHNAAFTPDGKRIATAEWQDGANIYDAATGKLLDSFIVGGPNGERPGRVGFLPDGKLVVHTSSWSYTEDKTRPRADGSPTVTQTLNYSLIVWDPATRKEVRRTSETLKYEGSHIWQLLVGRGQMMQLQQFEENGRSVKKTISFTDPATGKATPALTIHKDDDHRFDLSPDGQTLLLRTAGQPPRLLDVTTGKVRATLDGYKRLVTGGAFSPDGKLVATVSGSDIDGYERAKLLPGGPPDGPAELVIWDAQAGQPLVRYTYPTGQYDFTQVGFSPDGQYLYAMTTEKRIVVWGQLPFRRPAPDEAVGIPRLADPAPKQPDPVRPFAGGQPAQPPAPAGIVADALDKLIESLPKSGRTAGQQVDALFLATLGRLPTATELKRIGDKYGATLKVENLRAIVIELTASPEFEAHVKTLQKRLGVPAIPQPFVPMFGPPKLDPEPGTDPTKKQ